MTSSGDGLGLELDRERGVERVGDALEDRQGRRRATGLEAGDGGLGDAGELGQVPSAAQLVVTRSGTIVNAELSC